MQPNDLEKALEIAKDISLRSGIIIKDNLQFGIKREWKSDQTPVTAVDKEINQLVIDTLSSSYPDHSILAEEGSKSNPNSKYSWVCDPLDGTFPFIHGIPIVTFALALVDNEGNALLGVIHDPISARSYTAIKGRGAWLNGEKIATSNQGNTNSIAGCSVGVVYWEENSNFMYPIMSKLTSRGARIFAPNSIAYMDALVAVGEFGATIFPGKSAHDSAAASCIVTEAGGVFLSLEGKSQRYDQPCNGHIAAANQEIYSQILQAMN